MKQLTEQERLTLLKELSTVNDGLTTQLWALKLMNSPQEADCLTLWAVSAFEALTGIYNVNQGLQKRVEQALYFLTEFEDMTDEERIKELEYFNKAY